MGIKQHFQTYVSSLKSILQQGYDAVFVGTAPRGRDLDIPGREACEKSIHVGIYWLASVAFEHTAKIGKRVLVLRGNTPWIAVAPPAVSVATMLRSWSDPSLPG